MTMENQIEDNGRERITPDRSELESDRGTFQSRDDEAQIIADQDMTREGNIMDLDENMGAKTNSLDQLEDEPNDFLSGEVDVKEQMDRTTKAMDYAIDRSTGKRKKGKTWRQ